MIHYNTKAQTRKLNGDRYIRIPILYKYIVRESFIPFIYSLFVFTGLLFLARILKLVDLVINKSVPLSDTIKLFSFVLPAFIEIALPMSLLIGILLAFGRLSADSELIVIRACGIGLRKLVLPLIALSSLAFLACLLMSFWLRPIANYNLGRGLFEIVKLKATAGLTAGVFNDFGPLTIYAEQIEEGTGKLNNVLISDRRSPQASRTFIAKYGQIISDEEQRTLSLRLFDGSIQEGVGLNFNYTTFERNNILLPHSQLIEEDLSKQKKRSSEMTIYELISSLLAQELLAKISENNFPYEEALQLSRYWVELQRRIAIPISCFAVTFLALALGVQPNRSNNTWGSSGNLLLGISLILIYYLLLGLCSAIASQSIINISFIIWIPNVIFFITGIYWLKQMGSDRWQNVSASISKIALRIFRKFSDNLS